MHVQHIVRAAPLVQVIDILGDKQQLTGKLRLQPRQRTMCIVRFDLSQSLTPHIVEAQNQIGIARKALRRRHILHLVLLPQSSSRAKRVDPAFCGNPCSGKDDDAFDLCHDRHETRMAEVKQCRIRKRSSE